MNPDGLVTLTLRGNLSGEETSASIKKTVEACVGMLDDLHKGEGKKLRLLIDLTAFSGEYEAAAMKHLSDLGGRVSPHVEKSVVLSGSVCPPSAEQVGNALCGKDAKRFMAEEREAALAWLAS